MVLILWAFDKCPLKEVIAKKGLNPGACSRLLSRAVEHLDGKICQLHLISFRPDKPIGLESGQLLLKPANWLGMSKRLRERLFCHPLLVLVDFPGTVFCILECHVDEAPAMLPASLFALSLAFL